VKNTTDRPDLLFTEAQSAAALREPSRKEMGRRPCAEELRSGHARPRGRARAKRSVFPLLADNGVFVINPTSEQLNACF
jgi:hypothetical protein